MRDYGGQIALGGTPGVDLIGLFYDVTRDDKPPPGGWSVHRWSVLDNPFFGATRDERYARTIQAHCDEFGLSPEDPEVQREWFGRWVKEDARFVYAVHAVPEDRLCYAKYQTLPDGTPDFDAHIAALPKLPHGAEWQFG